MVMRSSTCALLPEIVPRALFPVPCSPCLVRQLCTHAAKLPRTLAVRTAQAFMALQRARQRQQTPGFKEVYAKRAGIEGPLSQGVRAFELRRSR
jgi:transposase